MKRQQALAVGRRWVEILALALSAALLVCLLPKDLVGRCGNVGWLDTYRAVVLSPLLLLLLLHWGGRRLPAGLGLKHPLTYPSSFTAGLLGFALVLMGIGSSDLVRAHWGCLGIEPGFALNSAGVVAAAAVLGTAALAGGQSFVVTLWARVQSLTQSKSKASGASRENLLAWAQSDEPINKPEQLRFGAEELTQRILERLTESSEPLAIVGEVGAGKTSLMKVARSKLEQQSSKPRVVIVPVSVWSYNSTEAAVTAILSSLTRALGLHVNTWPIAGIPTEYLDLIEHVEGWPARIARAFRLKAEEPRSALEQYDRVAKAIGIRLTLWIEDLERFAGDPARDLSSDDGPIRLQPIHALMASLAGFESIGLVLAVGTWSGRFDIEKIVRRVERIPRLDEHSLDNDIQQFIDLCLTKHPALGPGPDPRQEIRATSADLRSLKTYYRDSEPSLLQAVATLCSNPRRLKFALRRTWDVWSIRAGEIDLLDVLLISTLRGAEPEVFARVESRIDLLRSSPRSVDRGTNKQLANPVRALCDELTELPATRRSAIERLLFHVFDQWTESSAGTTSRPMSLQRIRYAEFGRDYWQRYMSTTPLSEDEKDQNVLHAVRAAKEHADPTYLLKAFSDPRQQHKSEHACKALLTTSQVVDLIQAATAHALTEKPPFSAPDPAALVSTWRILLDASSDPTKLAESITSALAVATPQNLRVAHSLLHLFVVPDPSVRSLIKPDDVSAIRKHFCQTMRTVFSGREGGQRLITALMGSTQYTLVWCCWGLDRVRANALQDTPFEGWAEFSATILAATEANPGAMLPYVLPFLIDSVDRFHSPKPEYRYNHERAQRLFDMSRLSHALSNVGEPNGDEATREMLRAARTGISSIGTVTS